VLSALGVNRIGRSFRYLRCQLPETTLNATIQIEARLQLKRIKKGAWDCLIMQR